MFTHEIVRHRLCAFSQESLRFVRPTSLNAYFPEIFLNIKDGEKRKAVADIFYETFYHLEEVQRMLVSILGMDGTKILFSEKKQLQSAMRRLMPIGLSTGIIVTTNHRNWRHLIDLRTSQGAEEEIRYVFGLIADTLIKHYPSIYQDMTLEDGTATFVHGRV